MRTSKPHAWRLKPASACFSKSRSPTRRESHFRWIKAGIDAGRFGKLVQAEGNISRDRLGKIDPSSWRYQSAGMPGGVLLQIGIHYVDVLEMLMGPVKRASGMSAQLVLPGDNPDVANLIL
jgi:predicted dehydrogenase